MHTDPTNLPGGLMYWFWFFVMAGCPALLFPGMLGLFGEEAEKAADDVIASFGVALLVVVMVGIFYFALTRLWGFMAR